MTLISLRSVDAIVVEDSYILYYRSVISFAVDRSTFMSFILGKMPHMYPSKCVSVGRGCAAP